MSRFVQMLYIVVVLLGAVFVLVYRGLFWPLVRAYMGDWLVVQFIYLVGRFWISYRRRNAWAAAVLVFALCVEIFQAVASNWIPRTLAAELTVGSTFDPVDIAAYVLGVITVLGIEMYQARARIIGTPS